MHTDRSSKSDLSRPSGEAPLGWLGPALWVPACLVLGVLVAGAAAVAQSYFAPLVLFPLLVGTVLGAMTVGLMRVSQTGHGLTIFLGTTLAVVATVAGQHFVCYLMACQRDRAAGQTLLLARQAFPDQLERRIPEPPAGFVDYLRREAAQGRRLSGNLLARGGLAWLTWAVDGLLVLAAALAVVIPAWLQPYCSRCRSWYRTTRSDRLKPATARRLAEMMHVALPHTAVSTRYRLLTCRAGCSPTRFELLWSEPESGTCSASLWLDLQQRNEITRVLDQPRTEH